MLPLDGVRVIEVGQALAGPLAGVLLADMGADVIKIEKPDGGDDARIWGPPYGPDGVTSLYFYSQNRNKRSVALDLKTAADVEKLHRLCETADILIQNLRPGVVDEIGIGPEAMLKRHPRLIYCSIWAFGYQGPLRMKPGFDPLLQAYGGMMSVTGRPEDPPTFCGASINDKATGMFCTIGALAALRHARQDGQGLPGRHLAVQFGGALGRGPAERLPGRRHGAQAARHRRRGDRALPALRHGRPAGLPGARQRSAVGALRPGAGPSRMGDRSALRQERRARAQQGRAAAPDRRRHARPSARLLAGGVRQGRRAVQPGERHRRAGGDRAARRGRPGASASARPGERRPATESGRPADRLRPRAAALGAVVARSSASIRKRCWRTSPTTADQKRGDPERHPPGPVGIGAGIERRVLRQQPLARNEVHLEADAVGSLDHDE